MMMIKGMMRIMMMMTRMMMMMKVALQLTVDREAPGEGHGWHHQLLLAGALYHGYCVND